MNDMDGSGKSFFKKTVGIVTYSILLFAAVLNIGAVFQAVIFVLALLSPLFTGLVIAFILNILLRVLENKLFAPLNRYAVWRKIRRAVCVVLCYVLVILLMRLMGKRQIGQLQPFELVFSVIVADLAASPMSDVGIPLLYGVMPIAALMLCYALFSLVTLKSERARELLSGKPAVLVQQGVVDEDEMRRQGMTLTELMEQMRECGVANLSDVGCAVLEISGKVNVFPLSEKRAVTPGDLNLRPGYENLPLPLVLDGKVQEDSLRAARRSAKWLQAELSRFSVDVPGTYLCLLGTDGVLCVQKKGEGRLHFARSLQPEQVNW